MIHQINLVIQIATATLLGLVGILLIKYARKGLNTWVGIVFTFSVFCYTLAESDVIQSLPLLRVIIVSGAICIPVLFWILSRAIFDDHFSFHISQLSGFVILLFLHLDILLSDWVSWPDFKQIISLMAQLVSLGFVVAAFYVAIRTKQGDLVDERLRFRNLFTFGTAALIGITLIAETLPFEKGTITILQILQRSSIFGISLYFYLSNFEIRPGFYFREIPSPSTKSFQDPQLSAKLQALIEEQKVYAKEGLTIKQLAELMNEQEYRLRRVINAQLGFRNFNDFLNQYRVNAACEILSDPAQIRKTILEIAYDLGYQSIGPFNKAFKELMGTTPTAYRKSQVG